MYKLNLPDFEYTLKKEEGKVWIFDVIRKKFIVLTPEEWVRQHFINYLTVVLKYPKSLIRVEGGLTYNQLQKRSDILVFDREGNPWMVVECKAPTLQLSDATLMQVSAYNHTVRAKYISITNGLIHICAETNWKEGTTKMQENFPEYPEN
jgi:hypothetical protein